MAKRRRLLASLAFFCLLLGGGLAVGFHNSSDNSAAQTPRASGFAEVVTSRVVELQVEECSETDYGRAHPEICRLQEEALRQAMEPRARNSGPLVWVQKSP